jgi:hypothetical protein
MKTTNTALMDAKALEFLSTKGTNMVKKTLYCMTLLDGEKKLTDSPFEEVHAIAAIYDGYIFTAKAAKELASKLMKMYAAKNPHVFLTKKEFEAYTNVWYRKLYEAEGILGFEYVLDVVKIGKAVVKNPNSGISEKDLLAALRWDERREHLDKEESNRYHRKKGLELLGFKGFEEILLDLAPVIANIYELVSPKNDTAAELPEVKAVKDEAQEEKLPVQKSIREMKCHFIFKADIIEAYYEAKLPEVPAGYEANELQNNEMLLGFARRGLLKDSEAIMAYVESKKVYDDAMSAFESDFSAYEKDVIRERKDEILKLISNEW